MSNISSKVYIIHTLDNNTDKLDEEYEEAIEKWLSYSPIKKIDEITGTQIAIEKYMVMELEKLGYKVIKDKGEYND